MMNILLNGKVLVKEGLTFKEALEKVQVFVNAYENKTHVPVVGMIRRVSIISDEEKYSENPKFVWDTNFSTKELENTIINILPEKFGVCVITFDAHGFPYYNFKGMDPECMSDKMLEQLRSTFITIVNNGYKQSFFNWERAVYRAVIYNAVEKEILVDIES